MLNRSQITVYEKDAEWLENVCSACGTDPEDFISDLFANFIMEQAEINGIDMDKYREIERG